MHFWVEKCKEKKAVFFFIMIRLSKDIPPLWGRHDQNVIRGIVSLLRPADHAIFLTLVIMRGDLRLFFLLLHCAITLIEFTKPTNVRVQYYDDLLSHPSLTSNSSTLINKVSPEAS